MINIPELAPGSTGHRSRQAMCSEGMADNEVGMENWGVYVAMHEFCNQTHVSYYHMHVSTGYLGRKHPSLCIPALSIHWVIFPFTSFGVHL